MSDRDQKIIIAGASVAGTAAADALRQGGFEGSITLLSDERQLPYDRPPLSKELLSAQEHPKPIALRDPGHFEEQRINLVLGHGAAGLDIDRKYVITTDGDPLSWDTLIIATGSRPKTIKTVDGEALPTLRTVNDALAIRAAADKYGKITVVGASYIGLEIAASLRSRNIKVTVFGTTPYPLNQSVGPEIAVDIRDQHHSHGVELHGESEIVEIRGTEGNYELVAADGSVYKTPYVVAGIGIQPNTEWLVGSGVEPDPGTGGIVCDADGRTAVPGVWAVGDVALYDHPTLGPKSHVGHWTDAVQQGKHVAANITVTTAEPYKAIPYYWTDQFDRKYQCYGRRKSTDEVVFAEGSIEEGEYLALYGSDGKFNSVLSCGKDRSLRPYVKLLRRQASWDEALNLVGQLIPER